MIRNRLSRLLCGLAAAALAVGVAVDLGLHASRPASAQVISPVKALRIAPGYQSTTYPINADNDTDIWASTGPTTYSVGSIIATTGGSPNVVIPGKTGKTIVVVGYHLTNSVANGTIQWQDTAGSPNLLGGVQTYAANAIDTVYYKGGIVATTVAGNGLNLAVTGSSNVVGGTITYYYQ